MDFYELTIFLDRVVAEAFSIRQAIVGKTTQLNNKREKDFHEKSIYETYNDSQLQLITYGFEHHKIIFAQVVDYKPNIIGDQE